MDSTAKSQLRSFVERIERLEEEKKATVDDIKDVYGEAKATGFDTPALRAVIKRRQQDRDELKQHEAILGTYLRALGMVPMEEHWGAPKDDFADTKVTISVPGSDLPPVETTAGNLQKAADALDTPHGRKALKEFVARI